VQEACQLYTPLALVPGFTPQFVVPIAMLAVVSEMTGVVAIQIGASRRYDGPMGKSDHAFDDVRLSLIACGATLAGALASGVMSRWCRHFVDLEPRDRFLVGV